MKRVKQFQKFADEVIPYQAINNIIPFLKGDADMIGLIRNTIRKLFCMSDEDYEIFLMDLEDNYKK